MKNKRDSVFYRMSSKEKRRIIIRAMVLTSIAVLLFYRSLWAMVMFPLAFVIELKEAEITWKEERDRKLKEEFMHGIAVLNNSLQAGFSLENAWKEVEKETRFLYGTSSEFYLELKEINHRTAHNVPIEKLFLEFSYRCRLDEVIQFAELLEFGKRSGCNWKHIIDVTVIQMMEREEVRQEIEVMVAEKRMEQKIMNIMPLGLLAFLQFSAGDYMDVLYHNWFGVLAMSFFMIGYLVAIMLSKRILKVQI